MSWSQNSPMIQLKVEIWKKSTANSRPGAANNSGQKGLRHHRPQLFWEKPSSKKLFFGTRFFRDALWGCFLLLWLYLVKLKRDLPLIMFILLIFADLCWSFWHGGTVAQNWDAKQNAKWIYQQFWAGHTHISCFLKWTVVLLSCQSSAF